MLGFIGGPTNSTGSLLKYLAQRNTTAIFFFRGCSADEVIQGGYMRQAYDAGHIIGSYGCTGQNYDSVRKLSS